MEIFKYKFRAECRYDIMLFIKKSYKDLFDYKLIPDQTPYSDVEFEFSSNLTLYELKIILRDIIDSHIMLDTINYYDDYTGVRN